MNESSLGGLTHSQAVAALKATISMSSVVLVAMDVSKSTNVLVMYSIIYQTATNSECWGPVIYYY